MEAIYRAAPVGLAVLDADLRWVRLNTRMADIDGFSVEEHLGRSILKALPDIAPQIEPLLREVLQSGEPVCDREIRGTMPAQAGAEETWLVSYYPLKEPDGQRTIAGGPRPKKFIPPKTANDCEPWAPGFRAGGERFTD
jgi:PAS domain S-box-containing protein